MMMKIKGLLYFISFSAIFFELQGQNLSEQELDVITRNILSYHFRYALNYDLNLKSDKVLQGNNYFFNDLWPKENQKLRLDVLQSELKYPVGAFNIFTIKKRNFQIGNDSISISKNLTSLVADDIYLIAFDSLNQNVKFISGNFFLSSIQSDFDLHIANPKSFINYLMLRTFNWSLENIEFMRIKKGKLEFKGFSKYLKENVHIEVDAKDFDQVRVCQLYMKITY